MRISFNADDKLRLQEIHDIVQKMHFTDDNLLDMMNYLNEAIGIAKKINPERGYNSCLNNLLQTKEKQVRQMIDRDVLNNILRELYFNDAKTNFLTDLSMFCSEF